MVCESIRELLSAYLDNEIDDELKRRVEQHLAVCSECVRDLDTMRLIDDSIREAPVEEPSREFVFALNRRIQDRISARPRPKWLRVFPLLIPIAATALIVLIVKNIEPATGFVSLDRRISYTDTKPEPVFEVAVPEISAKRKLEARHADKLAAVEQLKEEAAAPAPAATSAQRSMAGRAVSAEVIDREDDDHTNAQIIGGEMMIPEIPQGRVVRAIIDTSGRILRIATGRNMVPEADTFLENRLQGQKLIAPTVSGKKQQLYVDLTICEDTSR